MATISKRTNKDGSTAYRIRVEAGRKADGTRLKSFQTTWKPDPKKSDRQNAKALNEFAVLYEEKCKSGKISNERRKFGEYGRYIVDFKYKNGDIKNATAVGYMGLFSQLEELDGIDLDKITGSMLTALYEKLIHTPTRNSQHYILKRKVDPLKITKCRNKSEFCNKYNIAASTFNAVLNGDNVTAKTAEKLAKALDMPISAAFTAEVREKYLAPKTIRKTHALVSMVLSEAVKDGIIESNAAMCARLPKHGKSEAEFLNPDELGAVLNAADNEAPQIRLFVYLLAASGGRRGEVIGLRWQDVNFTFNQIHFNQTIIYRKNLGIYTDTPKNEKSNRFLRLPTEIMQMLKDYKSTWEKFKAECGTAYPQKIKLPDGSGKIQEHETDFIFIQYKHLGYPLHPDTANSWLNSISEKYGLRPLHPHMFRHSAASTLIYSGIDVVSVAGYLGHASPTTTENIYSHALQEAQNRNAEAIGAVMFHRKKPLPNDDNGSGKKAI